MIGFTAQVTCCGNCGTVIWPCVSPELYVVGVGLLFLTLPRLLESKPYLMPWDYWWVFLLVTLHGRCRCVRANSSASGPDGSAAGPSGLFYLTAIALGLWLGTG